MLFGHQNDDDKQAAQENPVTQSAPLTPPPAPSPAPIAGVNPLAVDPETGASLPTVAPQSLERADEEPSVLNQSPATPSLEAPSIEPASLDTPAQEPTPVSAPEHGAPAPADNDLLHLKQQALSQLSPLVGKLDQSPEEKFRTTMMLIQSTDNQSLLQEAYDAAQSITDEKARAQALLDVVNEINYFTQQKPAA
jgi:hypothetical protein